jgi:hypothetical protein
MLRKRIKQIPEKNSSFFSLQIEKYEYSTNKGMLLKKAIKK